MLAAAMPLNPLARLNFRAALDILIIAILIYYLLRLLRGTRAVQILVALALIFLFYRGAQWARLEMVEWLLTMPSFPTICCFPFSARVLRCTTAR
jgi:DNA integrity scanning protein DisA with diadenylate cyclase activity